MSRIIVAGPGRAGGSLALALTAAGHEIVAVVGRTPAPAVRLAARVGAVATGFGDPLPGADLLLIAVRDEAIRSVADRLAPVASAHSAVHVSGLVPVAALEAFAGRDVATGSFHPLQTLPDADLGAAALAGAWIGVTAPDLDLRLRLRTLAEDLGASPFDLDDEVKPLYHAAAAAAANYPLAALAMASDLFREAGVPFAAARPLVETVVANAFGVGPRAALTGPIARGDTATVAAQRRAVREQAPRWEAEFVAFARALAVLTGRAADFEETLG